MIQSVEARRAARVKKHLDDMVKCLIEIIERLIMEIFLSSETHRGSGTEILLRNTGR